MIRERLLLRIAALTQTDRNWLLGNVPPEIHARLIAAIDTPSQTSSQTLPGPSPEAGHREQHRLISGASPGAVATVLEQEPAWIVAAILQIEDWPWYADVIALLPGWQRPAPAFDKSVTRVKPAMAAALLERLAAALPGAALIRGPLPRSPFERLLQRLCSTSRSGA